jgi:hypothetical protein
MATTVEGRDVARARRPRWGAWIVIVPAAIGLIAFAALHPPKPGASAGPDSADWRGKSAQGLAVSATINGKWLDGFGIRLRLSCDGGARAEPFLWTPSPELYAQQGDELTASVAPTRLPATNGWKRTYEGRLRMVVGDRPRGTASVRVTWARRDARVVCESGPVAFSLTRG